MVRDIRAQIMHNFTYHAPDQTQQLVFADIRRYAKAFALLIERATPSSREQSMAISRLEEAVFWANAAVARQAPFEEVTEAEMNKVLDEFYEEVLRPDILKTTPAD